MKKVYNILAAAALVATMTCMTSCEVACMVLDAALSTPTNTNYSSSSYSSSYTPTYTSYTPSGNYSSSSSSYSSSSSSQKQYRECKICSGTGKTFRTSTVASFGNDKKVVCPTCGETHWRSTVHHHNTCSNCHGSGKVAI